MIEIRNAKIRGTKLGREDHGIMTAGISLDYGNAVYLFVDGVLRALEIDEWEKLVGATVRVRAEHSKVHAIGHFLKDRWFDPAGIIG